MDGRVEATKLVDQILKTRASQVSVFETEELVALGQPAARVPVDQLVRS